MIVKIVCIIVIGMIALVFGFFPKWFSKYSTSNNANHNKILGISNTFSAGIFLGIAFFHLLPEATEAFEKYFKELVVPSKYQAFPFQFAFAFTAYALILFIEKIAFDSHSLIDHEHEEHGHGNKKSSIDFKKTSVDEFSGLKPNKSTKNEKIFIEEESNLHNHNHSSNNFNNIKTALGNKDSNININNNGNNHGHSHNNHEHNHEIRSADAELIHEHEHNHDFDHKFTPEIQLSTMNNLKEPLLFSKNEENEMKRIRKNSAFECLDLAFKAEVLEDGEILGEQYKKNLFNYQGADSDEEEAIIKNIVSGKGKYMAFLQMRNIKCK